MRIASVLLLAVLAAPAAAQQTSSNGPTAPEIVAAGRGEVWAMADRATIQVALETQASTATAAAAENARKQQSVLAALSARGVPERDISTARLTVRQDRTEQGLPLARYSAVSTVEVRTDKLDEVGQLIDMAQAAGATRVLNVGFSVAAPEPLQERAYALAVDRARARASAIARAAGGELGQIIEIATATPSPSHNGVVLPDGQGFGYGFLGAPISMSPEAQVISASLVGRWVFVRRPMEARQQ